VAARNFIPVIKEKYIFLSVDCGHTVDSRKCFSSFSGAYISQKCSVADTFHFDTDPDPMITDPDPGRILTKVQSFEISFFKENFCGFPLSIKTRLKYSNP